MDPPGAPPGRGAVSGEHRTANIEHPTSNVERGMKTVRPTASTPHPALSSVEEERRTLFRAHRILEFASFALFADRDWRLGSRRDLHAGSVRYEARAPRFLDSRHSRDSRIKSAWNKVKEVWLPQSQPLRMRRG